MNQALKETVDGWFYEQKGERKGPVPEDEIARMVKEGILTRESAVWKKGLADWVKVENTELKIHLDQSMPPPLVGEHVNNTVVWILAFAPFIGLMLEYFIAGAVHADESELVADMAVEEGQYWYVTVALNLALSYWDSARLKKAGTDTSRFSGMSWLIPVYLYKRAKALKHNLAYFIVWTVCFVLMLFL